MVIDILYSVQALQWELVIALCCIWQNIKHKIGILQTAWRVESGAHSKLWTVSLQQPSEGQKNNFLLKFGGKKATVTAAIAAWSFSFLMSTNEPFVQKKKSTQK